MLALGSVYGGMCLGPVNTAAVHALAYPLGSDFKVPHGLSNALLLPYVMEYNLEAGIEKFAQVARVLGVNEGVDDKETAINGVVKIKEIMRECNIPEKLSDINIPEEAIESMAKGPLR